MADADASVHEASVEAVLISGHEKDGVARRQLTLSAVGTMAVAVVFLLLAMTFGETLISSCRASICASCHTCIHGIQSLALDHWP